MYNRNLKRLTAENRQKKGYEQKDRIKVGDKFEWRMSQTKAMCLNKKPFWIYYTSGSLKDDFIAVPYGDKIFNKKKMILTVCKVYESTNGYGPFVDYWLSADGLVHENEPEMRFEINGFDALYMKKAE